MKKDIRKTLIQIVKFNLVSTSVTIVQLLLANILPLLFDRLTIPLPPLSRLIFRPEVLFSGESKYVVNGVVTLGYVLPFFLSNFIANIYGYFMNMKATFAGKGTRYAIPIYFTVLMTLILFTTWLQGVIVGNLALSRYASHARTIASFVAGNIQVAVIFPLEKFVLFKEQKDM